MEGDFLGFEGGVKLFFLEGCGNGKNILANCLTVCGGCLNIACIHFVQCFTRQISLLLDVDLSSGEVDRTLRRREYLAASLQDRIFF